MAFAFLADTVLAIQLSPSHTHSLKPIRRDRRETVHLVHAPYNMDLEVFAAWKTKREKNTMPIVLLPVKIGCFADRRVPRDFPMRRITMQRKGR